MHGTIARRAAGIAAALVLLALPARSARGAGERAHPAQGSVVSGQLLRDTRVGRIPASGLPVRLLSTRRERGRSATVYSDAKGWYRFEAVPRGEYYVEVVLFDGRIILRSNLVHVPGRGSQVLTPISVPASPAEARQRLRS